MPNIHQYDTNIFYENFDKEKLEETLNNELKE